MSSEEDMVTLATLALAILAQTPLDGHDTDFWMEGGQLEVRAELDGRTGWFTLDSAGPTWVDPKFLGKTLNDSTLGMATDGVTKWKVVKIGNTRFGGAWLAGLDFLLATPAVLSRLQVAPSHHVQRRSRLFRTAAQHDSDRL